MVCTELKGLQINVTTPFSFQIPASRIHKTTPIPVKRERKAASSALSGILMSWASTFPFCCSKQLAFSKLLPLLLACLQRLG